MLRLDPGRGIAREHCQERERECLAHADERASSSSYSATAINAIVDVVVGCQVALAEHRAILEQ